MNAILDKIDALDLQNLDSIKIALSEAEKIKETEEYSIQVCNNPDTQEKLNLLLKFIKRQKQKLESLYVFRGFLIFIISASFKTAEDMIWKLQDAPAKRLNRRLKYSCELKNFNDGRYGHTFVHNSNPAVPEEFIRDLESDQVGGRFIKNPRDSDYFRSMKLMEGIEQDVLINSTYHNDQMEIENEKREINCSPTNFLDSSATIINDIYDQTTSKTCSPCAQHQGIKLRTDCLICKEKIPEKALPIKISKSFLKRLNVTDNLMKFLANSQDKKAQMRENVRQDARHIVQASRAANSTIV